MINQKSIKLTPYAEAKNKASESPLFNERDFQESILRGESEDYLSLVNANKDLNISQFENENLKFKDFSYSTKINTLLTGVMDNDEDTNNLKEYIKTKVDSDTQNYMIAKDLATRQQWEDNKGGENFLAEVGSFFKHIGTGVTTAISDLGQMAKGAFGSEDVDWILEHGSGDYFRKVMAEENWGDKINEKLYLWDLENTRFYNAVTGEQTTSGKWTTGVGDAIGHMIPSIALNFIPYVGQALSITTFGMQMFSGSMREAFKNPAYDSVPTNYIINSSFLKSAVQTVLEYSSSFLLGATGLDKLLGTTVSKGIFSKALGKIGGNLVTKGLTKFAASAFSEGIEEVLQEFSDRLINIAYAKWTGYEAFDKENPLTAETVGNAFLIGALTSIVMSGGEMLIKGTGYKVANLWGNTKTPMGGKYNFFDQFRAMGYEAMHQNATSAMKGFGINPNSVQAEVFYKAYKTLTDLYGELGETAFNKAKDLIDSAVAGKIDSVTATKTVEASLGVLNVLRGEIKNATAIKKDASNSLKKMDAKAKGLVGEGDLKIGNAFRAIAKGGTVLGNEISEDVTNKADQLSRIFPEVLVTDDGNISISDEATLVTALSVLKNASVEDIIKDATNNQLLSSIKIKYPKVIEAVVKVYKNLFGEVENLEYTAMIAMLFSKEFQTTLFYTKDKTILSFLLNLNEHVQSTLSKEINPAQKVFVDAIVANMRQTMKEVIVKSPYLMENFNTVTVFTPQELQEIHQTAIRKFSALQGGTKIIQGTSQLVKDTIQEYMNIANDALEVAQIKEWTLERINVIKKAVNNLKSKDINEIRDATMVIKTAYQSTLPYSERVEKGVLYNASPKTVLYLDYLTDIGIDLRSPEETIVSPEMAVAIKKIYGVMNYETIVAFCAETIFTKSNGSITVVVNNKGTATLIDCLKVKDIIKNVEKTQSLLFDKMIELGRGKTTQRYINGQSTEISNESFKLSEILNRRFVDSELNNLEIRTTKGTSGAQPDMILLNNNLIGSKALMILVHELNHILQNKNSLTVGASFYSLKNMITIAETGKTINGLLPTNYNISTIKSQINSLKRNAPLLFEYYKTSSPKSDIDALTYTGYSMVAGEIFANSTVGLFELPSWSISPKNDKGELKIFYSTKDANIPDALEPVVTMEKLMEKETISAFVPDQKEVSKLIKDRDSQREMAEKVVDGNAKMSRTDYQGAERKVVESLLTEKTSDKKKIELRVKDLISRPTLMNKDVQEKIKNKYDELNSSTAYLWINDQLMTDTKGKYALELNAQGNPVVVVLFEANKLLNEKTFTMMKENTENFYNDNKDKSYTVSKFFNTEDWGSELKSTKVSFTGKSTHYNPNTNTIYIGSDLAEASTQIIIFALLHELQHTIQKWGALQQGFYLAEIPENIVTDIESHHPELFENVNSKKEKQRIASEFIYFSTGEARAYMGEVNFLPVFTKTIAKDEVEVRLPWGRKFKIKGNQKSDFSPAWEGTLSKERSKQIEEIFLKYTTKIDITKLDKTGGYIDEDGNAYIFKNLEHDHWSFSEEIMNQIEKDFGGEIEDFYIYSNRYLQYAKFGKVVTLQIPSLSKWVLNAVNQFLESPIDELQVETAQGQYLTYGDMGSDGEVPNSAEEIFKDLKSISKKVDIQQVNIFGEETEIKAESSFEETKSWFQYEQDYETFEDIVQNQYSNIAPPNETEGVDHKKIAIRNHNDIIKNQHEIMKSQFPEIKYWFESSDLKDTSKNQKVLSAKQNLVNIITPALKERMLKLMHRQLAWNIPYEKFINMDVPFYRVQGNSYIDAAPFVSAYMGVSPNETLKNVGKSYAGEEAYVFTGRIKPKNLIGYLATFEHEALLPVENVKNGKVTKYKITENEFYPIEVSSNFAAEKDEPTKFERWKATEFKSPLSGTIYVSNAKARGTNLQYYKKKFKELRLDENLYSFLLEAKLDQLNPNFASMIKDGILLKTDIYKLIQDEKLNSYTYDLVNKHFFNNIAIASNTEFLNTQASITRDYALYKLTKTFAPDIVEIPQTEKQKQELLVYITADKSLNALYEKYIADFNRVKGEDLDVDFKYANLLLMKFYDGSLNKSAKIGALLRLGGVKHFEKSREKIKMSLQQQNIQTGQEIGEIFEDANGLIFADLTVAFTHEEMYDEILTNRQEKISQKALKGELNKEQFMKLLIAAKNELDDMSSKEIEETFRKEIVKMAGINKTSFVEEVMSNEVVSVENRSRYLKALKSLAITTGKYLDALGKLAPNEIRGLFSIVNGSYVLNPESYITADDSILRSLANTLREFNKLYRQNRKDFVNIQKQITRLKNQIKKQAKSKKGDAYTVNPTRTEFSVVGEIPTPAIVEELLDVTYEEMRYGKTKFVSNSNEKQVRINMAKFFESNADTFANFDFSQVEEVIHWLRSAVLEKASKDEKRVFNAMRIFTLSWLLEKHNDGTYELSPHFKKIINETLEDDASNFATGLAIWRQALVKVDPDRIILQHISKMYGVDLKSIDTSILRNAIKSGDPKQIQDASTKIGLELSKELPVDKWWQKLLLIQRTAMLSNPRTIIRNNMSNIIVRFGGKLADFVGKITNFKKYNAVSYNFDGVKIDTTTEQFAKTFFEKNGLYSLIQSGLNRFDVARTQMSSENILAKMIVEGLAEKITKTKHFKNEKISKLFSGILSMHTDDPFIKSRTKELFSKLLIINKVDTTNDSKDVRRKTVELLAEAYTEASVEFMHTPNIFSKVENALFDWNKAAYFGVKATLPFMASSWNWFVESMRWTPLGLAKSVVDLVRMENTITNWEKRKAKTKGILPNAEFAEQWVRRGIGKGILGTFAFGVGILLGSLGVLKLDDDDDKIKMTIGDVTVDISSLTGSSALLSGAWLTQVREEDEDKTEFTTKMLEGAFNTLFEDFFINTFIDEFRYSNGVWDYATSMPETYLSSLIPALFSNIATSTYDYKIKYSKGLMGMLQRLGSKIPIVNQSLPKRIDPFTGEYALKYENPTLWNLVNALSPIRFSQKYISEEEKISVWLGQGHNELTGKYAEPDYQVKDLLNLNEWYGQQNKKNIQKLINNELKYDGKVWSKMTYEEQQKAYNAVFSRNANYAKIRSLIIEGYVYYATPETVANLKKLGITSGVKTRTDKKSVGFYKE